MKFKLIERKLREPNIPYVFIPRKKIEEVLAFELNKNRKFLFINSISGYGKTIAVKTFLDKVKQDAKILWYNLDEWDKDPIVFMNYIYNLFKRNIPDLSENLEEYLLQQQSDENFFKSFIGFLANEIETNSNNNLYLVIDNFKNIEKENTILKILTFLFNYAPENLKIIFISDSSLPELFYPYILKQEMAEILGDSMFLDKQEASLIFEKFNLNNPNIIDELLLKSNNNISLFVLIAQKIAENDSFLADFEQNILYKTFFKEIIQKTFDSFSNNVKKFISQTIFFPKINEELTTKFIKKEDFYRTTELLKKYNIIFQSENKIDFYYNDFIVSYFEEFISLLPENEKDELVERAFSLLEADNQEFFIHTLIKIKLFNKVVRFINGNYEYYFRNNLYSTLSKIVAEVLPLFPNDNILKYIEIRLYRSTGRVLEASEKIKQVHLEAKTYLIKLEEGIIDASLGNFKESIIKLEKLYSDSKFEPKDELTLINCLGISSLHNHEIDKALEYLNKAIELKIKLDYHHDLIKVYHNLGLAYTWKGEFQKSIESYEQSIYLSKQLKVFPLAMTYNNLAIIHNLQGDYDKSLIICNQGLEIVNKLKNNIVEIYLHLTLFEIFREIKNYQKVQESQRILEELLSKTPNTILDALLLKQKAYLAMDNKDIEKARELMLQAIHIRKLVEGDPSFVEYKLELAIIDFNQGNYKEVVKSLSSIEEEIKKGEHTYHLARLYVFKTLSLEKLADLDNYSKYKALTLAIFDRFDYKLLKKKLAFDEKVPVEIKKVKELVISTFGDLEISFDGNYISKKDWSGKKTKLLFVYLLLNKTGVLKDKLVQILFSEGEISRSAIHVLINRVRKALASIFTEEEIEFIQYYDDVYKFNLSLNYSWDSENFEYFIKKAYQENKEEKFTLLEKALSNYKDHFMNGFELDDWIFSTQEYYKKMAYKAYNELSQHLFETKKFDELFELSKHFFELDNCFESACENKMKALASLGRKSDALKQYEVLATALKKQLSETPSEELKLLKENIASNKF